MVRPGIINLDFADIRAIMDEMGKAMMGTGEASGEDRAIQAAEKAIANPLLDEISLKGAHGVLINITGGHDLTLFEMDEAANRIREEVDEDANIIVGSTLDTGIEGVMRVSVVATGIDAAFNVMDIPVPRRSMKAPLAQAVSFEQSETDVHQEPVETEEVVSESVSDTESHAAEPDIFDVESDMGDSIFVDDTKDDLPPPAYQPQANNEDQADDFFHMEDDDRSAYVAPRPQPTGQPSAETMARLHAAATNAANREPQEPASTSERVEKTRGFGLNSLISKMTGHTEERDITARDHTNQPSFTTVQDEPEMNEEQERIEIPAFLRRQAN
jgi:cell division protein FtsZ